MKIIRSFKKTKFKIAIIRSFTDIYQEESTSDELNSSVKISSNHILLQEFITCYVQSFMKKSYLHFEWLELSAGQVARLNIYSRLYYAMNRLSHHQKDVVIIVDEGELYYHPEWQRKWLWYFLKSISSIYINKRVQVIISTHSPFILSDLPSQNIIFLKKGDKGVQVIEGLEDNQLTFASNINTLLSNSFL
nr:AAA family ATPase [Bacillus cereus]